MQLVVPMAGLGQRFADAGYELPKPLIPVDGQPMVVRAVGELPPCDRIVFVVHPEHVRRYAIDVALQRHFPRCRVVATPGLTEGQACTVRLAAEALDEGESVLVAACDNSHAYDRRKFERLAAGDYDCLLWTYRNDSRVLAKPAAYGWVRVREGSIDVAEVSCKQPISQTPLADHAVSGCFWFRRAGQMLSAIDRMVAANRRVNDEFYLDVVPNLLVESGARVGAFEVDKYIGWGTPHELDDYLRWQRYFAARGQMVRDARNQQAVA